MSGITKTITIILLVMALASAVWAAKGYEYTPGVVPHTRYNPLREDCYYYYGYGSCNVTKTECDGVRVGVNRWVDLGDACLRNEPPQMTNNPGTITVYETEKVIIPDTCVDEDPVNYTYSGWTDKKVTVTTYDDAGTYKVHIVCTDSFGETDSGELTITVLNKNRAPLFRFVDWEVTQPELK
ncbi:hypothetical protein JW711_03590 [Candidatus Woesearchaeota archaeon]|nr:hypothetical protein [Candidatus Woesearchaeota archaeon]